MADSEIEVTVLVEQNTTVTAVIETGVKGDKGNTGVGLNWITLTQAEYDALSAPEQDDSTKVYNISDA